MEYYLTTHDFLNLVTLTGLEIVLGIDNVIFIAILVQSLSPTLRTKVRTIGLSLAVILRIMMLFGVSWIINLKEILFSISSFSFSGRDILLILGGGFLIIKAIIEFIKMFDHADEKSQNIFSHGKIWQIILQIIFIDVVLSFDSIITAIALSPNNLAVIIASILISLMIVLRASQIISEYIYTYPSIKVIGLSFIILVGIMLVLDGFHIKIAKEYLYFAIFFASIIETINIALAKANKRSSKIGKF